MIVGDGRVFSFERYIIKPTPTTKHVITDPEVHAEVPVSREGDSAVTHQGSWLTQHDGKCAGNVWTTHGPAGTSAR